MKLGPDEIIAILKLSVRYDWFTITILAVVKSKWTVISIKYDQVSFSYIGSGYQDNIECNLY